MESITHTLNVLCIGTYRKYSGNFFNDHTHGSWKFPFAGDHEHEERVLLKMETNIHGMGELVWEAQFRTTGTCDEDNVIYG